MIGTAIIDETKKYRYRLTRDWTTPLFSGQRYSRPPTVTWIMLNPSTADGTIDDPTIRRCIAFSNRWECTKMIVVNLYAMRATNPKHLLKEHDPVGPDNWRYIRSAIDESDTVIAAWGAFSLGVPPDIQQVLKKARTWCLGKTKDGHPKHPLYVKTITERVSFNDPI